MKKMMVIYRGQDEVSYSGFIDFMLRMARKADDSCHPEKFHITFTDTPPPVLSVIPFRKKKIGVFSLYFDDDTSFAGMQQVIERCGLDGSTIDGRFAGSYSVEEEHPLQYDRTWNDAELTPGVCLLTLFRRRPGIDHAGFLDRWHNSHTPLSLRIHPLWHSSHNVVHKAISSVSENWEGIVEEHFRKRSHLLNPFMFFGNPLTIIPNMIKVYRETNAFLDYKTIETYLVREVVVKSRE